MADRTKIAPHWNEALAAPGKQIDIGRCVVCDACSDEYTDSPLEGGFILCSMAICPQCAPEWMASITSYGEQHMIRGQAQPGESFADFVRAFRGTNTFISVGPIRRKAE